MSHKIFRPTFGGTRPVRISDTPTYLPNASRIGYAKWEASPGDFVRFEAPDGTDHGWGRVVGRITSHLDSGEDCRGGLVVVSVGSTCTFGAVRWIDPAHVTICAPIEQAREFLARLLSADSDRLFAYSLNHDARSLVASVPGGAP